MEGCRLWRRGGAFDPALAFALALIPLCGGVPPPAAGWCLCLALALALDLAPALAFNSPELKAKDKNKKTKSNHPVGSAATPPQRGIGAKDKDVTQSVWFNSPLWRGAASGGGVVPLP